VDRAVKITNWLTRKMLRMAFEHVSENETESRSKKLLRLIVGKMTINELTRKSQWLRAKERSEIINELVACGYVLVEQENTKGRAATYVKRVDDALTKVTEA
jgi:Cdc6-like AAA superfamily ATPase